MKRAYTLVEMLVVVAIVMVAAALITPNLIKARQSGDVAAFEYKLKAVALMASTEAVRRKEPIQLGYKDDQFQLTPVNDTITITQSANATTPQDENGTQPIMTLSIPPGASVTNFFLRGQQTSATDFLEVFYRDGRTSEASIEIDENGRKRSLDIYPDGRSAWREGLAADRPTSTWPAGDLMQRVG